MIQRCNIDKQQFCNTKHGNTVMQESQNTAIKIKPCNDATAKGYSDIIMLQ